MDEPDRYGVEEVQLLAPALAGNDEAGLLEDLEVLHHSEARHRHPLLQSGQRLTVLGEQGVEQVPPSRVCKGLEYRVHAFENR